MTQKSDNFFLSPLCRPFVCTEGSSNVVSLWHANATSRNENGKFTKLNLPFNQKKNNRTREEKMRLKNCYSLPLHSPTARAELYTQHTISQETRNCGKVRKYIVSYVTRRLSHFNKRRQNHNIKYWMRNEFMETRTLYSEGTDTYAMPKTLEHRFVTWQVYLHPWTVFIIFSFAV